MFVGRIQEYMAKATKEAKVHTSWINPNDAVRRRRRASSSRAILDPSDSDAVPGRLRAVASAWSRSVGAVNSLAPDAAQADRRPACPTSTRATSCGTSAWSIQTIAARSTTASASDCCGRSTGAVERAGDAAEVDAEEAAALRRLAHTLTTDWADGRVKLYTTWRALGLRQRRSDLFRKGAYLSLVSAGNRQEHVCAFAREYGEHQLVVVVPRLVSRLLEPPEDAEAAGALRFQSNAWGDTVILLPDPPGALQERVHRRGDRNGPGEGRLGQRCPLGIACPAPLCRLPGDAADSGAAIIMTADDQSSEQSGLPRSAGILLHPTSLPGPHGVGDLGSAAYRFVDLLQAARQSIWQMMPLGPVGLGNSPYSARSAFAGAPLLVSLEEVVSERLARSRRP